jgi:hypothetical protein
MKVIAKILENPITPEQIAEIGSADILMLQIGSTTQVLNTRKA